jgi:hypothetical protein
MSLKSFIPFTAEKARKGHLKYLHRLARGHDVLLMVEWADGQLTELPADLHPGMDGWYEATNGLLFAPIGEGTDPISYHGVDVVRVHAMIACPISTTAALQSELDEHGEYEVVTDDNGYAEQVVYYETTEEAETPPEIEDDGPEPTTTDDGVDVFQAGENGGDAGVAPDGGHGRQRVKAYNVRPPAPAVGWQFDTDQVKQRAPNAVSPNMLQRAKEYGQEMAFGRESKVRYLLLGMGAMIAILGILVILAIVYQNLTSGGGGAGGADQNLSVLVALAAPGVRAALADLREG